MDENEIERPTQHVQILGMDQGTDDWYTQEPLAQHLPTCTYGLGGGCAEGCPEDERIHTARLERMAAGIEPVPAYRERSTRRARVRERRQENADRRELRHMDSRGRRLEAMGVDDHIAWDEPRRVSLKAIANTQRLWNLMRPHTHVRYGRITNLTITYAEPVRET